MAARTAAVCLLGGMGALILLATLEMRRASHARSSAGDLYHKVISHAEGGQGWHLSFEELKDEVHKKHQEAGEPQEENIYGKHQIAGLGERPSVTANDPTLLLGADSRDLTPRDGQPGAEAHRMDERLVQAERVATAKPPPGGWGHQEGSHMDATAGGQQLKPQAEDGAVEAEEDGGSEDGRGEEEEEIESQLGDQGQVEPKGSRQRDSSASMLHTTRAANRPSNLGTGSVRPRAPQKEQQGHRYKLHSGTGAGSGPKGNGGPQQATMSKQRVVQAPPGTREAVANGLKRINPLELKVANMMGAPIRLNGVPGSIKPCFLDTGRIGICRNSRGQSSADRKKEQHAEEANEGGDGTDARQDHSLPMRLQPGDNGYTGVDMYKFGFSGSIVMNQEKYSRYQTGDPLRIVKYKSQCALGEWAKSDSPPRGCDSSAAKVWNRSRGYDRIGQINPDFMALLPPVDVFAQRPMYTSCAVVGNGGSLLLNEMGPEIDKHEAIIRFNGGITKAFEKHVGSRTTVRFLNTQHIGFHEFEDELLVQHATSMATMEQVLTYKLKHPELLMFITDADFHQYVLDEMGDGAASNGFYGTVFSSEMCHRVTLFGFYKSWGPAGQGSHVTIKYHYYDKVEPNVSQKSRDDKETPALVEFLSKHSNKFQFGEPTAVGAAQFGK